MDEVALRAFEPLLLSIRRTNTRTIAFTAPEPGSGVSNCAFAAAALLARSGMQALLLDLANPLRPGNADAWSPGREESRRAIKPHEAGFDRLKVATDANSLFLFNNVDWFRSVLDTERARYDFIILDLAPIGKSEPESVNPLAAACACDALLLVCRRGHVTRQGLATAAELARSVGAPPMGVVMTQHGYRTPGEEIALSARRFLGWVPPLRRWVERRARASAILN